jgi:hypothetical protein
VVSSAELQLRSDQYIAAHRARTQALAEAAPRRRSIPKYFEFNPHAPLRGQIIFIRRTMSSASNLLDGAVANEPAQHCAECLGVAAGSSATASGPTTPIGAPAAIEWQ